MSRWLPIFATSLALYTICDANEGKRVSKLPIMPIERQSHSAPDLQDGKKKGIATDVQASRAAPVVSGVPGVGGTGMSGLLAPGRRIRTMHYKEILR